MAFAIIGYIETSRSTIVTLSTLERESRSRLLSRSSLFSNCSTRLSKSPLHSLTTASSLSQSQVQQFLNAPAILQRSDLKLRQNLPMPYEFVYTLFEIQPRIFTMKLRLQKKPSTFMRLPQGGPVPPPIIPRQPYIPPPYMLLIPPQPQLLPQPLPQPPPQPQPPPKLLPQPVPQPLPQLLPLMLLLPFAGLAAVGVVEISGDATEGARGVYGAGLLAAM